MPKSEKQKASQAAYAKTHFTSTGRHYNSVAKLDDGQRGRLDRVLLESEVPLVTIAKRFGLDLAPLRAYLKVLGFRVGYVCKETGTQERIPIGGSREHSAVHSIDEGTAATGEDKSQGTLRSVVSKESLIDSREGGTSIRWYNRG